MQGFTTRPYPPTPLPTYRHLLAATSLTPYNPLRVIAHCDIDAAYAQFEAVRLGIPDDQPLISFNLRLSGLGDRLTLAIALLCAIPAEQV